MKITSLSLPEVLLISPNFYSDQRGFFVETLRSNLLREVDIPDLVQQNQSRSNFGVLRGLHYQLVQPQGKLVRVSRGSIFDVAVDIRKESVDFGKWVGEILDDIEHRQLWVPPGFAHGFLVLSDTADVCYSCSDYYHPKSEHGIAWNDPDISIEWPKLHEKIKPVLSKKDINNPNLKDQSLDNLPSLI